MEADETETHSLQDVFARLGKRVPRGIEHWRTNRISPVTLTSASDEVCSLALFAEAAGELERSEFLGEDDPCGLTEVVSDAGRRIIGARFGSEVSLKSVLGPFRRIWLKAELSNFGRTCGILLKYGIDEGRVAYAIQQRVLLNYNLDKAALPGENISRKEIVDLWLNTQYAHGGTVKERLEFDDLAHRQTPERLEFEFRHAIKLASAHFLTLLRQCVRPELIEWRDMFGLQSAIRISDAFHFTNGSADGTPRIIRRRAGSLIEHETTEQRFSRVIDRDRFRHLKVEIITLFRLHSVDRGAIDQATLKAVTEEVSKHSNFLDLIKGQGVVLLAAKPPDIVVRNHHGFMDSRSTRSGEVR